MSANSGETGGQTMSDERSIEITWVEKYVTYQQSPDGRLSVTDFHFLAEVCYRDIAQLRGVQATLYRGETGEVVATYDSGDPRAFSNGYHYTRKSKSHDSLQALDAAHPAAGTYVWEIRGPKDTFRLPPIRIGGPEARTAIPEPSPIFLSQGDAPVADVMAVLPHEPLTIAWRPFSNGRARSGTQWQDLIFVLVSGPQGEIVYTGGAPGLPQGFIDYTRTSTVVPAGTLSPGTEYVAFISCVKYVDFNASRGIEQLACNSFAVELPIRTIGAARQTTTARRIAPYLWSRKTPATAGMVPWPSFVTDSSG